MNDPGILLFGLFLLYGVPALLTFPVWFCVRRLTHIWDGRDFMDSVRPASRHVAHAERLLRVRL